MTPRLAPASILCALTLAGCPAPPEPALSVRLVDRFADAEVTGTSDSTLPPPPPAVWDFDDGTSGGPDETEPPAYRFHQAPNTPVRVDDGKLVGQARNDLPLVHLERSEGLDSSDTLHAIEVRMRVSAGTNLSIDVEVEETVDFERILEIEERPPFLFNTPIVPGEEFHTYTILARNNPFVPTVRAACRHLVLHPTEKADATFEIDSVRLISRREHLAGIPSGVGWQGLSNVFRETLVARSPEILRFQVDVPEGGWFDAALGTVESSPLRFAVTARRGDGTEVASLRRTLTRAERWDEVTLDLSAAAGTTVGLELALDAENDGTIGLWGSPAVRSRGVSTTGGLVDPLADSNHAPVPQGVLVVVLDTLRRDHLEAYGYDRETAPHLRRFAAEGTLFADNIAQGSWTKVSVPSLFTSLYPSTLSIVEFTDRVPAAATTLAEVFREAGYVTWASSSVPFSGQSSNLHQGYEVLHERAALKAPEVSEDHRSKTARAWVDRLLPWIERHRSSPFFAFLHVMDPHDPYEPYEPYASRWSEPGAREAHAERLEKVREHIEDPSLRRRGLPHREELDEAGVDAEAFVRAELDWYDASVHAMDAEIGRVLERLDELGLAERTLVVVTSDHGEEFLDHGRHFHEMDVYGEMINVPLVVRWPGVVPAGRVVDETVENLDLMPTILELARLPVPDGLQGHSLVPLLGPGDGGAWRPRPAVSEWTRRQDQIAHGGVDQRSIILDGWKLIHNVERPEGRAEYELYRHRDDPLDQVDVAAEHPDVVEQLAAQLEGWYQEALAARLSDAEALDEMSAEELERLRSLGYVQ